MYGPVSELRSGSRYKLKAADGFTDVFFVLVISFNDLNQCLSEVKGTQELPLKESRSGRVGVKGKYSFSASFKVVEMSLKVP